VLNIILDFKFISVLNFFVTTADDVHFFERNRFCSLKIQHNIKLNNNFRQIKW